MDELSNIGSISGIISIALLIIGIVYKAVNHSYVKSSCCGKEGVISLDIGSTLDSPPDKVSEKK